MDTLTLTCHTCRWPGEPGAENCAYCGRWLIVPDPNPPKLPRCRVGNALAALWSESCRVARGQAPADAFEAPLLDTLARWQSYATMPNLPPVLKAPLALSVEALRAMHGFILTREVALLNHAWAELLPAAQMVWELSRATGLVDDNSQAWLTTDDLVMAFDNPED